MKSSGLRKFLLSIVIVGAGFLLLFPGTVFDLLVEFFHSFFELLYELLDLLFELIETMLDHLIEELFHTNLQQTQTIVFYVMVAPLAYIGYRILRRLPSTYRRLKDKLIDTATQYKSDTLVFWQNLSAIDKIILIATSSAALYLIFLTSF